MKKANHEIQQLGKAQRTTTRMEAKTHQNKTLCRLKGPSWALLVSDLTLSRGQQHRSDWHSRLPRSKAGKTALSSQLRPFLTGVNPEDPAGFSISDLGLDLISGLTLDPGGPVDKEPVNVASDQRFRANAKATAACLTANRTMSRRPSRHLTATHKAWDQQQAKHELPDPWPWVGGSDRDQEGPAGPSWLLEANP